MAVIVVDCAKRSQQEVSLGLGEPLAIVCEGADEMRVRGLFGIELTHKLTEAQREGREPAFVLEADGLARWTSFVELEISVVSWQIPHPRSAGSENAAATTWKDVASLRVRPWGARRVQHGATMGLALLFAAWTTLTLTAAGAQRAWLDAGGALVAIALAMVTAKLRATRAPLASMSLLVTALALSSLSLRATVVAYNPSDAFVLDGALVPRRTSRWSEADLRGILGDAGTPSSTSGCHPSGASVRTDWNLIVDRVIVLEEPGRFTAVSRSVAGALGVESALRCTGTGDAERCCLDRGPRDGGPMVIERRRPGDPRIIAPTVTVDSRAALGSPQSTGGDSTHRARRRDAPSVDVDHDGARRDRAAMDACRIRERPRCSQPIFGSALSKLATGVAIRFDDSARDVDFRCPPQTTVISIVDVAPHTVASISVDEERYSVDQDRGIVVLCVVVQDTLSNAIVESLSCESRDRTTFSIEPRSAAPHPRCRAQ